MPVDNFETYKYYSVGKNGKIRSTGGEDKDVEYDFLYGILTSIDLKEDVYEGEKNFKWHFKLETPEHDHVEILQMGEGSSAARGLMISLMSIPGPIYQIRVIPYKHKPDGYDKTFTNLSVRYRNEPDGDWEKIEWDQTILDHLPPSREGDNDNRERRIYIRQLAVRIKKQKLNNHLIDVTSKESSKREVMDQRTGEVKDAPREFDGIEAAEATYGPPKTSLGPARGQQPRRQPAPVKEPPLPDFDDVDDDLPF
jgi:hypothetical protein